jgi:type IV pilus assembly protein PilN
MIRINLLGDKVDTSASHVLQIAGFVACLILAVGVCFGVQSSTSSSLEIAKSESQKLQNELNNLKKITRRVRDLEKKKTRLHEMLTTIANLRAKQHTPVRVIDELNNALPERAWLTSVKERAGMLHITGVALDNQTIALFMHALTQSRFFGEIRLDHSKFHKVKDANLKEFSLAAEITDPLKVSKEWEEVEIASEQDLIQKGTEL